MTKHFFLLLTAFALTFTAVQAQDVIVKMDSEQIKAKVVEIGSREIRFKYFDAPNGPILVINRAEVKLIRLKTDDGTIRTVVITDVANPDPMSTGNNAILNKTSALKFNFFSPLGHQVAFYYEWMLKPGINLEAGLGIAGVGVSTLDQFDAKGGYVRAGAKFLLGSTSDIAIEGARYAHPLKGRYFKVETIFYSLATDYDATSYSSYNPIYPSPVVNANTVQVKSVFTGAALDLVYGRQFIFGNSITIGYYAGFGYALENQSTTYPGPPLPAGSLMTDLNRFAFYYGGSVFPVTFTAGFNVGIVLVTPYWLSHLFSPSVSSQPQRRNYDDKPAGVDRQRN